MCSYWCLSLLKMRIKNSIVSAILLFSQWIIQLRFSLILQQESEWSTPWNGRLCGEAMAALDQYAIMLDLNDVSIQFSWWHVGSRVANVDAGWTLSQLHRVQAILGKGAFQAEELAELRSSLASFVRATAERLREVHRIFPHTSGVLAHRQLTYSLK